MKKLLLSVIILFLVIHVYSQTLTITSVSPSVICGNGSTDTFKYKVSGTDIPANANIVIYQSTNPNFNPYIAGQGDSIAGIKGDSIRQPNGCIKMLGLFMDACLDGGGDEGQNEYMTIASGEGIKVSNLAIDFGISNNAQGATNADINFGSAPCTFKPTPQAALITNLRANAPCSNANIIPVGPGDSIPPNSIILLFTSDDVRSSYNMSGLCAKGFPIYVLQNECRRTIGAFSNISNTSQNCNTDSNRYRHYVVRNLATGCYDSLVYDRCHSQTGYADGTYAINLPGIDTLSIANGGIKNNAGNSCSGIDFTSDGLDYTQIVRSSDTTFSFSVPPSFCNTGFHTIKAILNPPNAPQTVSNAINFKLVCLDITATPVNATICSGQNAVINNSSTDANATFSWTVSGGTNITGASGGNGNQINQTLTNTGTTKDSITYSVTATDDICTKNKTVKIVVNPILPKPNLGNDTTICGNISKLLSTGNTTTTWTRNGTQIATNTATITATQAGTFIASITGTCGNVADTIVIAQTNTQPKPDLGKDTSYCGAFSKTLTTGIVSTVWLKDGIQVANNTITYTATQTGTYIANVTGSCGTASDTIVISQTAAINFDFGTNTTTVCNGGSISLDASNAYDSYLWNTGSVSNIINITVPGKYWVDVFKNGCKGTDTITVTQIQPPVKPNLGNDTAFCGTFSKTLSTGNNTTTWLKDGTQIATNSSSINITQTGTYVASITNSCATARDTIVISQTGIQTKPDIGNDTSYCGAFSRSLTTGNAATVWSTGVTASSITVTQAGTYIANISGSCGITGDTIVIIKNDIPLKPFLGNDTTYCDTFSRVLNTGNIQTTWTRNNVLIATAESVLVKQGGTYIAKITNSCGSAADTIIISNANALNVNLGRDSVLCTGKTLILNATTTGNNITYLWNTGELTPKITVPAQFKRYTVEVSNGVCIARDTIIIDSAGIPKKPDLGNDTTFCGDFSKQLITGDNTFWSTGEVGIQITVTTAGQFIAENRNVCGNAKDTIVITKYLLPVINLGKDSTICDSIILSVGNGIFNSILWSTNDTIKSIIVTNAGLYTVKVSNNNCNKTDSISIAKDCDYDVYLPNAFSPNFDNNNDVLVPLSFVKGIEVLDFIIFNRWSEKVYEAKNFAPNDKAFGWNGTFKGEASAMDHYAYYYIIKLQDGKIKTYKGTVALMR